MKTSILRFVMLSATFVTLLGCFKADSHRVHSNGLMQPAEVKMETIVDAAIQVQAQQIEERKRKEEELHINFPNVFNIFRYLF